MDKNIKDSVIQMAFFLYLDLPFWKRWKVFKFYNSNNWDVTGAWEKCVKTACKMARDADYISSKFEENNG